MKILFITTGSALSQKSITGGQIYQNAIFEYFNKRETCFTINIENAPLLIKKSYILYNIWMLFYIVRNRYDLIIEECCYTPKYLFLCNWIIKFISSVKIVALVHALSDYDFDPPNSKLRRLIAVSVLKLFLTSQDKVIANSQYIKTRLNVWGVPENRISVVSPAGQSLASNTYSEYAGNSKKNMILCVGKIRPLKGQSTLIEALSLIANHNVKVCFAGAVHDMAYFQKIKDLAVKLKIESRIKFLGNVGPNELCKLYSESAIFVHPSLYEAYGMVLHEAMRFGLPVIASNVGGIPEIIDNNINGILVEPGNAAALGLEIERLMNSLELRGEFSRNAEKKLNSLPSWDSLCEEFYNVVIR